MLFMPFILLLLFAKGQCHIPFLSQRANLSTSHQCPLSNDTYIGSVLSHFTGIFLGDYTSRGIHFPGALAVAGNMEVPIYVVTSKQMLNCTHPTSNNAFATYSLVVGGQIKTLIVSVNGNGYIAGGGDIDRVEETVANCTLHTEDGTGMFNFTQVEQALVDASEKLSKMMPTRRLESNGLITTLADDMSAHPRYRIFTMNTCQGGGPSSFNCSDLPNDSLSDPSAMLFGKGTWNGPSIPHPGETDSQSTTVINIPVTTGQSITLSAFSPSQGFRSCSTIYNFYPVLANGTYDPTGSFDIVRSTGGPFSGLILAPKARILEGPQGGFVGQVFAHGYTWIHLLEGSTIYPYPCNEEDHCSGYFDGCFPVVTEVEEEEEEEETEPSPSPSSSSSSSSSSSTSSRDISNDSRTSSGSTGTRTSHTSSNNDSTGSFTTSIRLSTSTTSTSNRDTSNDSKTSSSSTRTSNSRTSSNSDSTGSFTTSIALSPSTTTARNHHNTMTTTNNSDKFSTNNSSSSHDVAYMHSTRDLESTATLLSTTGFPNPTTSFDYTLVVTETIITTPSPVANIDLPFATGAPDAGSNSIDDLRTAYELQTTTGLVTEYGGLIMLRSEYHKELPAPVKDVTVTRKVQVTAHPKTTSTVFILL